MIIGFSFTKLNAEKKEIQQKKVNVSNNIVIKNVEEHNISLGKDKKDVIKFTFEFTSKYEPEIGKILFEGEILYLEDPKKTKEIFNSWKKDKKVPDELVPKLLNAILAKCNIQALILSQEVNLPSPIPIPKLELVTPEKNYIG